MAPETDTERLLPGTKNCDLYRWPSRPWEDYDPESPLAVQEYLQTHLRLRPRSFDAVLVAPSGLETRWQYEHMRLIIMELNHFVVNLMPVCNNRSCPKMKATDEWLFLCACHKTPQECSAMDYSLHTVDGAATVLNSQRYFAERSRIIQERETFQLFSNMLRRLYRILAHAYYHHREEFDNFESERALCERFVRFGLHNKLLNRKHLIMPVGGA